MRLYLILIVLFSGSIYLIDQQLNLRSLGSWYVYRNVHTPVLLKLEGAWKDPNQLVENAASRFPVIVDEGGIKVRKISMQRRDENSLQRTVRQILTPDIYLITFDKSQFEWELEYSEGFRPMNIDEVKLLFNPAFALPGNFHDGEGMPLGLVMKNGQVVNPKASSLTAFYFRNSSGAYIGSRSLYNETRGVTEAFQIMPSLMRDGQLFSYIGDTANHFFDDEIVHYRSLAGMDKKGNFMFLLPGPGAFLSIAESGLLAKKLGFYQAVLFDGGMALQYFLKMQKGEVLSFFASNKGNAALKGNFSPQRSPVYLCAYPRKVE